MSAKKLPPRPVLRLPPRNIPPRPPPPRPIVTSKTVPAPPPRPVVSAREKLRVLPRSRDLIERAKNLLDTIAIEHDALRCLALYDELIQEALARCEFLREDAAKLGYRSSLEGRIHIDD